VTASLPMPDDAHPDEPDGESIGARGSGYGSPVRSLPPKPATPAEEAAAQSTIPDAAPRVTAKRPPRRSPRKKIPADPGPPPPLPADLVIPPKPPLPAESELRVEPESAAPDVAEPEVAEPEVVTPQIDETDAEPEPEGAAAEPEVVAPEREVAPEPEVFEPEPVIVAFPAAAEPEPHAEQRDVVAPDAHAAASVDTVTPALVVKGVTKAFGETRAVDGIDLTVPAGIFYGLVGPNGAGKTTTLSMIAGLLRPDRGTIRVNGVDAASDPLGAKRQMGVLPDRLRTFDRLTGRQLLHYYGVLRGLPAAVVESRTTDLARAFDLSDSLGRVVSDYSAGMVKKVMLAGALIHSPRLLVLDEPFESVDPVSSAIILDILKTYVAHGGTVILSSHGMDLVERVCSRVAVIVAGQVLAEGTVDEVRGELTLEQRFIELAGGLSDVEGLEWLHTFSD
jgi:ABC-2 type transport system ATP-binding protein